jgi:hypothetical protein
MLLQKHFLLFFCLDAKEPKDQGKPDRSARFALPSPPSVQQISLIFASYHVQVLKIKQS